jgi:hypothetical protein
MDYRRVHQYLHGTVERGAHNEQPAHQLARVDVPDGGLPPVRGGEVDACETGVKDVGSVGVPRLKGDLPSGISDRGAV